MKTMVSWILSLSLLVTGCGTVVPDNSTGGPTTSSNSANGASIRQSSQLPTAPESPLVGHPAPNFDLKTLNEKTTVALHDLLGKQPILINAWASWCPPCQQETPDLVAMSKKYAGKIQFVGVNMTSDHDSVTAAKAFVHKYGITYPTLLDLKGSFFKDYQIIGYPTTFILEPNGMVQNVHVGLLTRTQMESLIAGALKSSKTT